jgi:subtilase family serine protease
MARAQFDQGVAPADLPMERMLLVLKRSPEQDSALHKLLDDQQDKASPNYHKWLTPEQFGKRFGPADQDIQVVTAWLQSHGFRIGSVAKGRNMIEFSGTAAQVQEALHTSIHKYLVNGEEHWANSSDPQIPTALTPVVAGVHTLHNFLKKPLIHFSQEKVSAKYIPGKPPEVNFSNGVHGLGPADYATIYNINPLYSGGVAGTGVTIGVAISITPPKMFRTFGTSSDVAGIRTGYTTGQIPAIWAGAKSLKRR